MDSVSLIPLFSVSLSAFATFTLSFLSLLCKLGFLLSDDIGVLEIGVEGRNGGGIKKKTPCRGFTLEVKRHVVQQAPKCYVVDFFF